MTTAAVPGDGAPVPAGGVVVVGSVNVDYVISLERAPGRGETVLARDLEVLGGGKGATQALAAPLSGANVELVACVGDDGLGAQRTWELQAGGVGTGHVRRAGGKLTGMAFVHLTPDGENDIVVAPGANALLSPADVEAARDLLLPGTVLLGQLEVPLEATERAFEIAGTGVVTMLNCSPWRPLPPEMLARVDVLVVNEHEAQALTGVAAGTLQGATEAVSALARLGPGRVVVTLGAAGAVVSAGGQPVHVPAPPARVVDTTGAGDAFTGAMAARLAAGDDLVAAVRFGVAVGSSTTESIGARAVVPAALLAPLGPRSGVEPRVG